MASLSPSKGAVEERQKLLSMLNCHQQTKKIRVLKKKKSVSGRLTHAKEMDTDQLMENVIRTIIVQGVLMD